MIIVLEVNFIIVLSNNVSILKVIQLLDSSVLHVDVIAHW